MTPSIIGTEGTLSRSAQPVTTTRVVNRAPTSEDPAPLPQEAVRKESVQEPLKINWVTAIFIGVFHVGAIVALFFFSWTALIVAIILYFLAINVGIGMTYHRLLTHRGYRTPKWLEYAVTVCGTLALEGGPIFWVATHRVHHQHSDQAGDPHSPQDGTWWAHAGWILTGAALHSETAVLERYAPDLARDRFHVWISKYPGCLSPLQASFYSL